MSFALMPTGRCIVLAMIGRLNRHRNVAGMILLSRRVANDRRRSWAEADFSTAVLTSPPGSSSTSALPIGHIQRITTPAFLSIAAMARRFSVRIIASPAHRNARFKDDVGGRLEISHTPGKLCPLQLK